MSVWRIVEGILSVAGAAWLAYYLFHHRGDLAPLLNQPPSLMAALLATVLITWALTSAQAVILFRSQGVRLGPGESFLITASTSLLNYVPMRLGSLLRLQYLRDVHGLAYSKNIGVSVLRLALLCWLAAVFVLVGVMMLPSVTGAVRFGAGAGVFIGALFLGGLYLWPNLSIPTGKGFVTRVLMNAFGAIEQARRHRYIVSGLLALLVLQFMSVGLRMYLAFAAVDSHIDWPYLFIIVPVAVTLTLVSFASLGVREFIVGAALALAGSDFSTGVLAASVERGALIVLSVAFGAVATPVLIRRLGGAWRLTKAPEPTVS